MTRRCKRIEGVSRFKRPGRKEYAYLRVHVEGDDVQLYMRHKGQKLVLLQGPLSHILDGIKGIGDVLAKGVPPMLASSQRKAAIQEAEDILGES